MELEIKKILTKIDLKERNSLNADNERYALLNAFLFNYCEQKNQKQYFQEMLNNKEYSKKIILSEGLKLLNSNNFTIADIKMYNELLLCFAIDSDDKYDYMQKNIKRSWTKKEIKKNYTLLYKSFYKEPINKNWFLQNFM